MKKLFLACLMGALIIESSTAQFLDFTYVFKEGAFSGITTNTQVLVSPQYQNLYSLEAAGDCFLARKDNKWGFINSKNEILKPLQYDIFNEQASFYLDGNSYLEEKDKIPAGKKGKWGLLDVKGEEVTPFNFDFICNAERKTFFAQKGEKVSILNSKGKTTQKIPYKMLCGSVDIIVENEDWRMGCFVSNDGKHIKIYDPLKKKELDFYGQMSHTFYDWSANKVKPIFIKGKYALTDSLGDVLPNQYDEILETYYGQGFYCRNADKWGYLDSLGKEVFAPDTYKNLLVFATHTKGLLAVAAAQDQDWALLNPEGKAITSQKFEAIEFGYFDEDQIAVKLQGKWGVVNLLGELLLPALYDAPIILNPNPEYIGWLLPAKINGKYGFIDNQGNIKIEPQFDLATPFALDSKGYVEKDGKTGYVNAEGEVKWTE